ncbi:MAG: NYN domain-containing protein [Candidatus Hydrogenedentes bacterium]|nr:NYN domain-containing protein [Candidatus Hydrogenedentota bacterium]
MRQRRIAILIDGAYFLKRLPHLVEQRFRDTPEAVATTMRRMCRSHVTRLTGAGDTELWRDYLYRIFFYDAVPYSGKKHHPLLNRVIDYEKSDVHRFRTDLFTALRKERNVALRLGKVTDSGDWDIYRTQLKKLLPTRDWFANLKISDDGSTINAQGTAADASLRLQEFWASIEDRNIAPRFRQKGVDMRIGLDIASITLKKQADTIVLVAGDSDFVPAAKLARREGVEFILDPMWQKVNDDLFEHIDGLASGLSKPQRDE